MLRLGGGLDNGERIRREDSKDWKYIYVEQEDDTTYPTSEDEDDDGSSPQAPLYRKPIAGRGRKLAEPDPNEGLIKKKGAEWEPRIQLPPTLTHRPAQSLPSPCDPENPRIFHMFWTGPFTDKPYLALLSFLFSQNTGIHLKDWPADAKVCRPQCWLWINPGPAASVPNPNAVHDMFEQLKRHADRCSSHHSSHRSKIKGCSS